MTTKRSYSPNPEPLDDYEEDEDEENVYVESEEAEDGTLTIRVPDDDASPEFKIDFSKVLPDPEPVAAEFKFDFTQPAQVAPSLPQPEFKFDFSQPEPAFDFSQSVEVTTPRAAPVRPTEPVFGTSLMFKSAVPATAKPVPVATNTFETSLMFKEVSKPVPMQVGSVSAPNVSGPAPAVSMSAPDAPVPVPAVTVLAPVPVTTNTFGTSLMFKEVSKPVPYTLPVSSKTTKANKSIILPEVSVPAPDVSVSAPVVSVQAPVVSIPAPEVSAPAPAVSIPAPEVSVPAPVVSIPAPEVSVPVASLPIPDVPASEQVDSCNPTVEDDEGSDLSDEGSDLSEEKAPTEVLSSYHEFVSANYPYMVDHLDGAEYRAIDIALRRMFITLTETQSRLRSGSKETPKSIQTRMDEQVEFALASANSALNALDHIDATTSFIRFLPDMANLTKDSKPTIPLPSPAHQQRPFGWRHVASILLTAATSFVWGYTVHCNQVPFTIIRYS